MPPRPLRRLTPPPSHSRWGVDTRTVAELFGAVAIGETVTYEDIEAMTGINLQERYHLVQSVKDCVREHWDIILRVHPGLGYERLTEPGKVDFADDQLQRVHRMTRRIAAIQKSVDITQLSPIDQHRYLAGQSLNAQVIVWTHPKHRAELEQGTRTLPVLPYDMAAHADLFRRPPPQAGGPLPPTPGTP